jgi:hypothetical protein
MRRCVGLVKTDVAEEYAAFIFSVGKSTGEE